MASKTTLNAKNLEGLGVEKLAQLLIEISMGSAANKRRLRLELAGTQSAGDVAREVTKRLSSIDRSRTHIDWRKIKGMKQDLETQRSVIVNTIANTDPNEALDVMWRFVGLANSIFDRCDDSNGILISTFHTGCANLGAIAQMAKTDSKVLSDRAFSALQKNEYGQYDTLIESLASALGPEGLERLKTLFTEWSKAPLEKPANKDRVTIGWSSNGPIYEDEVYGDHRDLAVRIALEQIADAQGDVDAFIAQQSDTAQSTPMVAADIARRLLAAGRNREAWDAIRQVDTTGKPSIPFEWEHAKTDVLDALGLHQEAQDFRWRCFERSLNREHLKAHLKRLPDFDDMEAEDKALAYARAFPDIHQALSFLTHWPAIGEAAKLVIERGDELNGDLYELLTPTAELLREKHPLAATILLRAMIDFALDQARATRYRHAARHLVECESLARHVEHFGDEPMNETYVADLKRRHGKKHGFWGILPSNLSDL
jgi:hypothetical protein